MRARIETVFRIPQAVFWNQLFFDREYNDRLYRELGFKSVELLALETLADGRIRQHMRAEPPLHIPEVLKKRLRERLFYTEDGTFDPRAQRWEFRSISSLAPEAAKIAGTIHSQAHADGMLHVVELDVSVDVFGIGGIIERVVERNARDSYKVTARFTDAYAREKGLC